MNVYLFELRRQWLGVAVWTAVLLIFLICLVNAVYPIFMDSREAVEAALEGFPPAFAAAFGMMLGDIFSFGGFSAFMFIYLTLAGGIMASSLGLSVSSREKRAKCTDFIMTKPISRAGLFISKLLASLTLLLVSNAFFILLSVLLYLDNGEKSIGNATLAASSLLLVELIFLGAGFFWGVFARKVRSISGSAMVLGFAGFILSALHAVLEEDWIRYFAPYKYFDVMLAFSEGKFEVQFVILTAALTIVLITAAGLKYCRGEIHAV